MNLKPRLPAVLDHRDYRRYLSGLVLSQIGVHGTFTAMLYHVYLLTGSTLQVGLVGAARLVAVLALSPLGGYFADRLDRKRLLQLSQLVSACASLLLALVTLTGLEAPWHVLLAAMVNSAAATFDEPVRKAVIPAMVPRRQLVRGLAVMNLGHEVGTLLGPALGGVLIAVSGPGLMYLLDGMTYVGLMIVVTLLEIPSLPAAERAQGLWSSVGAGLSYVRRRPLIVHLMGLDISAMVFAAYPVVLPALAVDVLDAGPTGYGVLAAGPAAGALLGGVLVYRLAEHSAGSGKIVIGATMGYGVAAIVLAQARVFLLALVATALLGLADAIAKTIRQAAVLLETPDALRGRVGAVYEVAAGGGPPLGELNIGWLSGLVGVTSALSFGGVVPILYASAVALGAPVVREYRGAVPVE